MHGPAPPSRHRVGSWAAAVSISPHIAATDTRCQHRRRLGTLWCLRASKFCERRSPPKKLKDPLSKAALKTNCVCGLDKLERSFLGAVQLNSGSV